MKKGRMRREEEKGGRERGREKREGEKEERKEGTPNKVF